jgi:hypothetical protein
MLKWCINMCKEYKFHVFEEIWEILSLKSKWGIEYINSENYWSVCSRSGIQPGVHEGILGGM